MELNVLLNGLLVVDPWILVEIIEGVNLDSTYRDDFAEYSVDNKVQGKYMNICKVLKTPDLIESLNAEVDDYVCVWSTAVESFNVLNYGKVDLVRNPDIFMKLDKSSEFYKLVSTK
jgi:hypothetical protein